MNKVGCILTEIGIKRHWVCYTFIDIMRVLEYGNDYSRVASIDEHDNITNYLQTKLQID